jgi:CRISPR/Cas system-associated exonuclease Cas4 (RecB family)
MLVAQFTWSYSSLKEYINCPKQYQEIKVLKNFTKSDTPQTIYGKEVHKALEDYVREGVALAKNYERFKPVLDELIAIPGEKYCEHEMALDAERNPCAYDDENRWVRGIADLLIVDGADAYIIDYKTGSNKYPDTKQLRLMSLMTFAHFPEVQNVKAGLLFIMHDTFITEEYNRAQIKESWNHFEVPLARLDNSYETDVWQPNPTPLCKWCPVTSCKFHKG